jgi:hypothetical protein
LKVPLLPTPHPNDIWYNATNQRFWLQYREHTALTFGTMDARLIIPSDTYEERTLHNHLVPVHCWVNLTHGDTYIHVPFKFAMVNGPKTHDCISQDAWDALIAKSSMYVNKVPKINLLMYSVHVDGGIHSIFLRNDSCISLQ